MSGAVWTPLKCSADVVAAFGMGEKEYEFTKIRFRCVSKWRILVMNRFWAFEAEERSCWIVFTFDI